MAASYATKRECPYCGTVVRLAECAVVATNFDGVEFLGTRQASEIDIELPSGTKPLRRLQKTGSPVIAAPPENARPKPERSGKRSLMRSALAAMDTTGGGTLPPLSGNGLHAEDLPARACAACEYPLPQDIDDREAVVIAVVGVNGVGKSHFIAATLTEAYQKNGLAPLGCTEFAPDDASSTRFMVDYHRPLFRQRTLLPTTQLTDEARFRPLIFNVTLDTIEPFNLVMHDIAGEALADPRQRARAATFLRAAKGIIFVIDPRDIEGVRDRLPAWVLEQGELGYDQAALLGRCLAIDGIAERNGMVPVAVTVGKADLLPEAIGESPPFLESADSSSESYEELLSRIHRTSDQVVGFLERYGAHNLLAPAREYERRGSEARRRARDEAAIGAVTYHAVSALGSTPDFTGDLSEQVRPINCIDPLASVLAQTARLSV